MTPRERILAVLNKKSLDRIPVDVWHTPEIGKNLRDYFGVSSDLDAYNKMGIDKLVRFSVSYNNPLNTDLGTSKRTVWGTELKEINSGNATYHEYANRVLDGCDTLQAVAKSPYWPKADYFDYSGTVKQIQETSKAFATLGPWVSFFEIYCQLRGLEQALVDIISDAKLTDAILDQIETAQTEMMKRLFEQAADNVDIVFVSDDMGSQSGLLISIELWKRHLRPRMKRWCDLIHSYGLKVFYHSDGAISELIPHLIDVGIDVLNPIQHVCPGMDMVKLKKQYGKDVVFHGGVENQQILPFGTIEQVRQETRNCLKVLGNGGGYIACSCHNIQAGTPLENIFTMIDTVKQEGILIFSNFEV
jgi:uroporphyrinogen decarboxylase